MHLRLIGFALVAACSGLAVAQDSPPRVTTTAISDGLYLLQGRGGNVVASVGDDGVLLIDDDYAPYQPAYLEAIEALGGDGVRFVVDTVIVPGHGSLSKREDLERYHSMLTETREEVRAMQASGMDLEAILAKGLDPKWESWGGGFITEEYWITFLVTSPR